MIAQCVSLRKFNLFTLRGLPPKPLIFCNWDILRKLMLIAKIRKMILRENVIIDRNITQVKRVNDVFQVCVLWDTISDMICNWSWWRRDALSNASNVGRFYWLIWHRNRYAIIISKSPTSIYSVQIKTFR